MGSTIVDTLEGYRATLERIFAEWEKWPRVAKFRVVPVMDYAYDRYLLVTEG